MQLEELRGVAERIGNGRASEDKVIFTRWYHDYSAFRRGETSEEDLIRNHDFAKKDLQRLMPEKSIFVSRENGSIRIAPKIKVRLRTLR